MRKWYVPVTVLGIGSVGLWLLSERGRNAVRALFDAFHRAPDALLDWNDSAQQELDYIQAALKGIAESLGPHGELSH
jgi:hypothetical protein